MSAQEIFKAGAGKATIELDETLFPTAGENYTHVHDDSYVHVLLLEKGSRICIVAIGTVTVSEPEIIAGKVAEATGTDPDHVIVHAKHVLSAPHAKRDETPGVCDALIAASVKAAEEAAGNLRPARLRFGEGNTDVNVNRMVKTDKGWWQGHNPDIPADHSLPVICLDDENGRPISVVFFCNTAPGVLENSLLSDGRRAASGDLAAWTERKLDEQFGDNAICTYLTGITGDHWQMLRAVHDEIDIAGAQTLTDMHEEGFVFLDILSSRLSEAVIRAVRESEPVEAPEINLDRYMFRYTGQKVKGADFRNPALSCEYIADGERDFSIDILSFGDIAVVAVGCEICSSTWNYVKERSPFKHTLLLEFAGRAGFGYLPQKDYYDKITYQSLKSKFYAGSAEKFAEDAISSLITTWNRHTDSGTSGQSTR